MTPVAPSMFIDDDRPLQAAFDGAADRGKASATTPICSGIDQPRWRADRAVQRWPARTWRTPVLQRVVSHRDRSGHARLLRVTSLRQPYDKRPWPFASAMNVAQHIDRRRHGIADADAAGHRSAAAIDAPVGVVDGRQCGLQELAASDAARRAQR